MFWNGTLSLLRLQNYRLIRAESINLCDELWLQDMPTLSVKVEQNLYTWMYARLIMMNFGQRREFRRDIYMGTL